MAETLRPQDQYAGWQAPKTGSKELKSWETQEKEMGEKSVVVNRGEKFDCSAVEFTKEFNLEDVLKPSKQMGNDRFTEVYLETESGNIYALRQLKSPDFSHTGDLEISNKQEKWYLYNGKEHKNRGRESFDPKKDLKDPLIKIGEPFKYGEGGTTTRITKITAVAGDRIYGRGDLHAPESDVRKRFFEMINEEKPKLHATKMTKEIASQSVEKYFQASEQEQKKRFDNINGLFMDKWEAKNDREQQLTNYSNFYETARQYPEKFQIPGQDQKEVVKYFDKVKAANRMIKLALKFFQAVKNPIGSPNRTNRMNEAMNNLHHEIDMSMNRDFANQENHQLNVPALTDLFEKALKNFIKGGETIGRKPAIAEKDVKLLVENMTAILKGVNSYR